jgi:hypothetical protein
MVFDRPRLWELNRAQCRSPRLPTGVRSLWSRELAHAAANLLNWQEHRERTVGQRLEAKTGVELGEGVVLGIGEEACDADASGGLGGFDESHGHEVGAEAFALLGEGDG